VTEHARSVIEGGATIATPLAPVVDPTTEAVRTVSSSLALSAPLVQAPPRVIEGAPRVGDLRSTISLAGSPPQPLRRSLLLPDSEAKRQLSDAYARAIAAHAGLRTYRPEYDDGIDFLLGVDRSVQMAGGVSANCLITVQLKARSGLRERHGTIRLQLERVVYDRLVEDREIPFTLFVLRLPSSRRDWTCCGPGHLRVGGEMYFLQRRHMSGTVPRGKKSCTVGVPLANRLTPNSMMGLILDAIGSIEALRTRTAP